MGKLLRNIPMIVTVLKLFVIVTASFAGPWPGQLPGTEIGNGLPAGYEPSGAAWHTGLNKLFTVWDNGTVSMMDYDGTNITNWSVFGDLEGVCIADPTTDFVYVGLERPDDGIKELNITSGQVTRFFDLTPWMQSQEPNYGLEALTFVPDTSHPEVGLSLPTLPTGWKYEGWAVIGGQPVTSGKFTAVDEADESAPYSGPDPGPPFPGEDYLENAPAGLTFPTDLSGGTAVISVEPDPDDDTAPFALKPLVYQFPDPAQDHVTYDMDNQAATAFPSGTASIE